MFSPIHFSDWEDMAGPNSPKDPDSPVAKSEQRVPAITPDVLGEKNMDMETIPSISSEVVPSAHVEGSSSGPDAHEKENMDCVDKPTPLDVPICDNKNMDITGSDDVGASSQSQTKIVVEDISIERDSAKVEKDLDKAKESVVPQTQESAMSQPVDDVKRLQPTPVEVKSKVSGDMVVVGRDANTPTDSCGSSNSKGQ
jgi:hypothetical protein